MQAQSTPQQTYRFAKKVALLVGLIAFLFSLHLGFLCALLIAGAVVAIGMLGHHPCVMAELKKMQRYTRQKYANHRRDLDEEQRLREQFDPVYNFLPQNIFYGDDRYRYTTH